MFNSVTVGEAGATMRTMVPGPPGRLDQYTSSFTCTTFFFAIEGTNLGRKEPLEVLSNA